MKNGRIEITYFKTVDGLFNITNIVAKTHFDIQNKYGKEVLRAYKNGVNCYVKNDLTALILEKELTLALLNDGAIHSAHGNVTMTKKSWEISTGVVTKETFTKIINAIEEAGDNLTNIIAGTRIAMEKTKTIII